MKNICTLKCTNFISEMAALKIVASMICKLKVEKLYNFEEVLYERLTWERMCMYVDEIQHEERCKA